MSEMGRERDLVLNPNEYAFVLDKTKGLVSSVVGPYKMSLSTSDALVIFNPDSKRFEEASYDNAVYTFITAPESWYIELKNPVRADFGHQKHPTAGTSNALPDLDIGKKVNIVGNASFALFPGQMAKVIQGHRLHSNQYLLARVYDADALNRNIADSRNSSFGHGNAEENESGSESETENKETAATSYVAGQILVIKGQDCPFYIPPTGIEVIPVGGYGDTYVRDAVTLEKLEYCILKNEKGHKRYIHGDAVVFPQPDETFIRNKDAKDSASSYKFHAYELTDISGIHVKVISDYEESGVSYHAGEELFITGKTQKIYYPRQEHAIIDYDGQVVHNAVAIPSGTGRYVLDRTTGKVNLVKGPCMYLTDPRRYVLVQRRLSEKQCRLWYPGNEEVLSFNTMNTSDAWGSQRYSRRNAACDGGFSRTNEYSNPRSIEIDNKYNGAVAIDIWTGWAINVISKNGTRKVITGPQTYLLEYDESLEVITLSTGKPKTTDNIKEDVYLRVENNKISDIINVQTNDFVEVSIKVSYCVDFLSEYQNKWFSIDNYIKYMTDRQRSILKMEAKKYSISEFYENATEIVRKTLLGIADSSAPDDSQAMTDAEFDEAPDRHPASVSAKADGKAKTGRLFEENGMLVKDVEVLSVRVENDVARILDMQQIESVEKALELANAEKSVEITRRLTEADNARAELKNKRDIFCMSLKHQYEKIEMENNKALRAAEDAAKYAAKEAEKKLQPLLDAIQSAETARRKEIADAEITKQKELDALAASKQKAYTESVKKITESISPDLVAALTSSANAEMLEAAVGAMSPYAIAGNESVADVTNRLLRGTPLEGILENAWKNFASGTPQETETHTED